MPSYRFRLNFPPYPMITVEAESEYAAEHDLKQWMASARQQTFEWEVTEEEFNRVRSTKPLPKIPMRY